MNSENVITKNVEINININIAKRMLDVAGFHNTSKMSDEEVFEKVLLMVKKYGATFSICD